jgi:type IV pilus assembly protein PilM
MNTSIKDWLKPLWNRFPSWPAGFEGPSPIGLDLGPERLNLVQMARAGGQPALRAIAALPYPCTRDELLLQPQKLRALLKQAFSTQPFSGRRVVSCLPASQLKIISLSYPHTEGQAEDAAIVAALRERQKGELDNMVIDYQPIRQEDADSGKRDALVALASREHVLAYLKLLTSAGLKVEALDIGPAALARVVMHAGARHDPEFPLKPNALLINFGVDSSYLTVIWGRRLVLDRAVEFCESRLLGRLKAVLDMPTELATQVLYRGAAAGAEADETARVVEEVFRPELALLQSEISKTLVYMASRTRGKSVDTVFLAGPLVRYPGLVQSLRQQLKVTVNILNPLVDFAQESSDIRDPSMGTAAGIALAAGLALRGVAIDE